MVHCGRYVSPRVFLGPDLGDPINPVDDLLYNEEADEEYGVVLPEDVLDDNNHDDELLGDDVIVGGRAEESDEEM